ncbi:MAG: penicillin binding protein PBP4B [Negativicutes bacterium]|nr:penicillin binding protein PBP4B [Negativicutes bacterium]
MAVMLAGSGSDCLSAASRFVADGSQIVSRFPDQDDDPQIYVLNRRSFRGYAGQGKIRIINHGLFSARLAVNGRKLTVNWQAGGVQEIDIGKLTRDGMNELQLTEVVAEPGGYCDIMVDYPVLTEGRPEQVGLSPDKLQAVDRLIAHDIEAGLAGAALVIVKNGKVVKKTVYGYGKKYDQTTLLPQSQWCKLTADTLFDLASNSKMYATVYALQQLVSAGRINIDDKVAQFIPEFDRDGYREISLRNLLLHNAGFGPEVRYFDPTDAEKSGQFSQERERTLAGLVKTPLVRPVGEKSVYSDTDFILLGYIVELVSGQRLDKYVRDNIYRPLGLTHTTYLPLANGFGPEDCAATERCGNTRDFNVSFPNIRTYTLQGEVHDEKCWYSLGGVAGHAGLFSNLSDLAVLMQVMLNRGGYGWVRLWDQYTQEQFSKISDHDITIGLGWNKNRQWLFGPYASSSSVGHSGWTGTATLIDFENDMAVALLTNRIHSPVVQPPNRFATAELETNRYGSVMALIYEAMTGN